MIIFLSMPLILTFLPFLWPLPPFFFFAKTWHSMIKKESYEACRLDATTPSRFTGSFQSSVLLAILLSYLWDVPPNTSIREQFHTHVTVLLIALPCHPQLPSKELTSYLKRKVEAIWLSDLSFLNEFSPHLQIQLSPCFLLSHFLPGSDEAFIPPV